MNSYKGDIWSFTVHPSTAFTPSPPDETTDLPVDATLSWSAGKLEGASPLAHELYIGTGFNRVVQASADNHPDVEFKSLDTTQFQPGNLALGATYYWRVDERYAGATVKGDIWSFTTIPFVGVEGFEDYNDYRPYRVFDTWIDGWENPDNGATVGYPDPDFEREEHFVETKIIHGGAQSMPLAYDNSDTARYSQAQADISTLGVTGDWMKSGATALVLDFYGDVDNQIRPTERMEISLEDTGGHVATVPYDGSLSDIQQAAWHEWNIDLQKFSDAGVDLSSVAKVAIGIGGPKGTTRGGSGTIYVDDIRLYVSRCLAQYQRDGGLAIVRAGGGHQPTDRDVAVHGVQMQFEPAPGLFLALAVFLRAPVAVPWQVGKILVQRPLELTLQASRLCLLGGLCYRCGRLLCRLLSPMNGGAIATDVPGDLGAVAVDDHRFLNALRQFIFGEGGKRP